MTSKTSSPDPMIVLLKLTEALTSHEYNDVTGTVTVNIADGLLAIAHAINRLASVQEKATADAAEAAERVHELMAGNHDGHA